jgi:hypothetical protein
MQNSRKFGRGHKPVVDAISSSSTAEAKSLCTSLSSAISCPFCWIFSLLASCAPEFRHGHQQAQACSKAICRGKVKGGGGSATVQMTPLQNLLYFVGQNVVVILLHTLKRSWICGVGDTEVFLCFVLNASGRANAGNKAPLHNLCSQRQLLAFFCHGTLLETHTFLSQIAMPS